MTFNIFYRSFINKFHILNNLLRLKLFKFALIGGIGFTIEAVIITAGIEAGGVDPVASRFVSFPIAVFVTWWLNRRLTFESKNSALKESLSYFIVQVFGAISNLAIYITLVSKYILLKQYPLVALVCGAIVGLLLNYILSVKMVFAHVE